MVGKKELMASTTERKEEGAEVGVKPLRGSRVNLWGKWAGEWLNGEGAGDHRQEGGPISQTE